MAIQKKLAHNKSKVFTTSQINVERQDPDQIEDVKSKVFTTSMLKLDGHLPSLRRIDDGDKDSYPRAHYAQEDGIPEQKVFTTHDLPSDLEKIRDRARQGCGERSLERLEKNAQKDLDKILKTQEKAPNLKGLGDIIPWIKDGIFVEIPKNIYDLLDTEEKRAYNLAKGRAKRAQRLKNEKK